MTTARATYYAITTTGQNWYPLAIVSDSRTDAEAQARAAIGDVRTDYGTDIYRETEQKNLRIVPKSQLRRYGLTVETVNEVFDAVRDMQDMIETAPHDALDSIEVFGDDEY